MYDHLLIRRSSLGGIVRPAVPSAGCRGDSNVPAPGVAGNASCSRTVVRRIGPAFRSIVRPDALTSEDMLGKRLIRLERPVSIVASGPYGL